MKMSFAITVLILTVIAGLISIYECRTIRSADFDLYGIILDAGSSSTKLRVYGWPETLQGVPRFEEVLYHKEYPGIGAFQDDLGGIRDYFDRILTTVKTKLEPSIWSITPIYLMATAGLRLLDEHQTKGIIDVIHGVMEDANVNPFKFKRENAHVLSGDEEALFAWLTINYHFGHFDQMSTNSRGILEIGGGSAQIAFIPNEPIYADKMSTMIGGMEYGIYCHSHLSFGATLMNERIAEYLVKENPDASVIGHPCMLTGDSQNVTDNAGETTTFVGSGNSARCEEIISHFLLPATDDKCSPKPCSIGQVYQPDVNDNLVFSTYGLVYKIAEILGVLSDSGQLDVQLLQTSARQFCQKPLSEAVNDLGMSKKYASRNCQDGLYVPMFISALGFPLDTKNIMALKNIDGHSVAWSIGAMLYEEEQNRYQEFVEKHFTG